MSVPSYNTLVTIIATDGYYTFKDPSFDHRWPISLDARSSCTQKCLERSQFHIECQSVRHENVKSVLIGQDQLSEPFNPGSLYEIRFGALQSAHHLVPISQLENVGDGATIYFDHRGVDHIEEVHKFLIFDIIQLDFLLILLGEITKEHRRKDWRVDGNHFLRYMQFLSLHNQNDVAFTIGRIRIIHQIQLSYTSNHVDEHSTLHSDPIIFDETLFRIDQIIPHNQREGTSQRMKNVEFVRQLVHFVIGWIDVNGDSFE
ncbi:hypothetical protein PFISCL1PPCAC_21274 [Pristionchus fissidentatus]|uniref:Uncharacterized protein n=1 Tax=Pristionchus fissidentatus TaxID=1538716 RepID=A0AAV5WDN5_9BILA|nr:hypothetical protein PFISCL1PPCAC_21274 [Pristionchus fissidentatus]